MSNENEITICELNEIKLRYERAILLMLCKSLGEFKMETSKQIKGINVNFVELNPIGKGKEFVLTDIKIDINIFD